MALNSSLLNHRAGQKWESALTSPGGPDGMQAGTQLPESLFSRNYHLC